MAINIEEIKLKGAVESLCAEFSSLVQRLMSEWDDAEPDSIDDTLAQTKEIIESITAICAEIERLGDGGLENSKP